MNFRDLAIGQTFDFINDANPSHTSFYDRCKKISARRYTGRRPGIEYQVGTIDVEVFHPGPAPRSAQS